jgi:hypothetical protein
VKWDRRASSGRFAATYRRTEATDAARPPLTTQPLRGIDEQVKKAEQAVAGQVPVKRNRFIQLSGGTRSVNRALVDKARALAGIKGYVTSLRACPDGTPVTAEFVIGAYHQLFQIEKAFRMAKARAGPAHLPPHPRLHRSPPDHRLHRRPPARGAPQSHRRDRPCHPECALKLSELGRRRDVNRSATPSVLGMECHQV